MLPIPFPRLSLFLPSPLGNNVKYELISIGFIGAQFGRWGRGNGNRRVVRLLKKGRPRGLHCLVLNILIRFAGKIQLVGSCLLTLLLSGLHTAVSKVFSISLLSFRCGGQGDLLSGSCAVFMHWCNRLKSECPDPGAGVLAGWAAARLSRACAAQVRITFD